ncbi:hypothetical protein BO71DRAFT_486711 [Aspergillus ellipticus CBS 707.79]|uniref:2EXR domain-containing protein n=1 Tax=Aspergillus ellipticus CBS 707.79 TaxID=1448320 RepID=A0A319D0V4_9EURO|nr:hypothetical protein BO71DRAFT_486711 [Aspergillus ellipticus CBS 707.79]
MSKYTPPSPYTYTDEKWKVHSVHPQRLFSQRKDDDKPRPARGARAVAIGIRSIAPRTAADWAKEADAELWASCESVEEYEERKRELEAAAKVAKENQPTFHRFTHLPIELRYRIWGMVMDEPTRIAITCSGYTRPQRPRGGRCGTVSPGCPRVYAATAFMSPLMLVNRETHGLASKRYRRAFQGVQGGGGVLAAYPSILTIEISTVRLLRMENLEMLTEIVVVASPGIWASCFYKEVSERFKTMLATGSIRRLELRLTRLVTEEERSKDEEYFVSLFSDIKAVDVEWVAPELIIRPGKEE